MFQRVAAVAHHGGAGTTTTAAAAGAPQVIVPQGFDQFYFAPRAEELGIGAALTAGNPTVDCLTEALGRSLTHLVVDASHDLAARMRPNGALTAVRRLVEMH
ncbi:nucleotide disphospho-sugar-binding domain-containing protein [Streptomyces sp. NPDC088788]|uniref:nucleotide disphospho-sugar-binding domain-containing protein n=1 Tax=Streptomyces sp. NPDC088788 TaxID=3365898 RepID=UPI00380C15EF